MDTISEIKLEMCQLCRGEWRLVSTLVVIWMCRWITK